MTIKRTNWTLFVPIHNLEMSKAIRNELKIERVTFISADRIPRVRKRLGLPYPFSNYRARWEKSGSSYDLFTNAKTYAVVRTRRDPDETLDREFQLVREAVYLLASSEFYAVSRTQRRRFGGADSETHVDSCHLFENHGWRFSTKYQTTGPLEPYRLDAEWKRIAATQFFFDLLTILNKKQGIQQDWRKSIRTAALLAGYSQFASSIWEAFIYDMIAIERLLVRRDEERKIGDRMADRLVALFGWATEEDRERWKQIISRLYDIRSEFVHEGMTDKLTGKDLLNADVILVNLLNNICRLRHSIKSQADIIELSERLRAKRILGLKPLGRPKGLSFSQRYPSEREIQELENPKYWTGML